MNKLFISLSLASVLLFGCQSKDTTKTEVYLPALHASNITDLDSVVWFNETYGETNKLLAQQYVQKSEAMEKEFASKAIWNMKRAITLNPTQKYYQKLVALLMQSERYEEASQVSDVLVGTYYKKNAFDKYEGYYVFEKPGMDDFYNYLLSNYLTYNSYNLSMMLSEARDLELNLNEIRSRLEADKRFKLQKGTEAYEDFALAFLTSDEIDAYRSNPLYFEKFINHIKPLSEPFTLLQKELIHFNYEAYRTESYGYSQNDVETNFLQERIENDDRWVQYNLIGKKQLNPSVWVIVYSVDTSARACPTNMRQIYVRMMTYTTTGTLIDSKIVAWQTDYSAAAVSINANEVTVNEFKRKWSKPFVKYDFDNDLESTEPSGEQKFWIAADGKITTTQEPVALAPSE